MPISIKTRERILRRQVPRRYGAAYEPAIRATVAEAPRISCASTIRSIQLGREIHTLSRPESAFALLVLMHPHLIDLHEQAMIPMWESPHPLDGCPGLPAARWPAFRGTVKVADSLGFLDLHPVVADTRDGRKTGPVAYPLIGDQLVFLRDDAGPYCVNLSIKNKVGDHLLPGPDVRKPYTDLDLRRARARFEIEEATFAEVGIRTVKGVREDLDNELVANLFRIYPYLCWPSNLPYAQRQYIEQTISRAVDCGEPPLEAITYLVARGVCTTDEARQALYVAVFTRRLRVNLFKPLLIDYPFECEDVDPLQRYRRYFER